MTLFTRLVNARNIMHSLVVILDNAGLLQLSERLDFTFLTVEKAKIIMWNDGDVSYLHCNNYLMVDSDIKVSYYAQ